MKVKIALATRSGYWFCGQIALTPVNSISIPKEVDLSVLTRQDLLGLHKAVKTKTVIIVGDGEQYLNEKAETLKVKKKEVTPIVIKEVPVVEEVLETTQEEVLEEEIAQEVVEEVVETTPKTRRTSTRTKK